MALKVVSTQQVTKDVNFLEDVKAKYVSIVKHGANREPFKVIKKEGGKMNVIQAILLPKEKSLSDFAQEEGLKWLAAAKTDTAIQRDSYVEYTQHPAARFKSLSEPQAIGKTGVSLILGALKNEAEKADLLTAPSNMMGTVLVNDASAESIALMTGWTAGDLLYHQIDSLLAVINGTLSQTALGPDEQKQTIVTAAQAFSRFIDTWTTAVGTKASETQKTELREFLAKRIQVPETKKNDGGEDTMTTDELRAILKEEVGPLNDRLEKLEKAEAEKVEAAAKLEAEKLEAEKKAAAEAAAAAAKSAEADPVAKALADALAPIAAQMTAQGEALKSLLDARKADDEKKKADDEKAKHTLVTDPKTPSHDSGKDATQKADDATKKEGIFKGVIFNLGKMKAAGLDEV